jgi:hypothetical protein
LDAIQVGWKNDAFLSERRANAAFCFFLGSKMRQRCDAGAAHGANA